MAVESVPGYVSSGVGWGLDDMVVLNILHNSSPMVTPYLGCHGDEHRMTQVDNHVGAEDELVLGARGQLRLVGWQRHEHAQ